MADEPVQSTNAEGGERGTQGTQLDDTQFTAAIAKALESNEGYKGLQRAFDRNSRAYQQQLAAKDAELARLKAQTSEMAEGLDFLSNKFIRALPPEQQAAVADELRQRKMVSLENEVKTMRQVMTAPPQQMAPQQFDQEQYEAQMRAILKEAQDSLEETVKDRGFDPKDKDLDFGLETETFAQRLRKLNASIKAKEKARDQKDLEDVRQKAPTTPTRTSTGSAPGDAWSGKSFWELGADEMWTKMREQARTGKRR